MAKRQTTDELIESAKRYAPNNELIQDILKKHYRSESKLAQLNFLKKQNEAQLRKLLRMAPSERKTQTRKCDVRRSVKKDTAKVKDIRAIDRPSVSNANVEIHTVESNHIFGDMEGENGSENGIFPDSGRQLHFSTDVDGECEVDRLRKEVTRLTRENYRMNAMLSGDTVNGDDAGKLNLKNKNAVKCEQCDNLRRQLESSETNLLRSERRIMELEKTVTDLQQQLNRLRTNEQHSPKSPTISIARSPTPKEPRTIKGGQKPRHVNRYCDACHRMKKTVFNAKTHKQRTPFRSLHSRVTAPDPRNAQLLSNFITEEYDRLLAENEKLTKKCRQLEERNEAVEALLDESKMLSTPSLACTKCLDLKKKHDSLLRTHKSLMDRFETERSRHQANYTLLDGQKIKLQRDLEKMKADSDSLLELNKTLRHDLVVAEGCALELQKMLAEKYQSSESNLAASKKAPLAEKASDTSDLSLQNKVAEDQSRSEWATYTTTIQHRDEEIKHLKNVIEQMEAEYRRFRAQIKNQEDDLHRMTKALESATDARKQAEYNRNSVEADLIRHRNDYAELQATVKRLDDQLRQAIMDKEYWQTALRNSIAQLREFESLMRDRQAEYERELKNAKATSSDGRRASDLEISNIEKRNLMKEIDFYRDQFAKTSKLLQEMEVDRETMLKQNESFQHDLAALRKSVLLLESDKVSLLQKLAVKNAQLAERKRQMENLNLELNLLKTQMETKEGHKSGP